jgi:hypothetical protein
MKRGKFGWRKVRRGWPSGYKKVEVVNVVWYVWDTIAIDGEVCRAATNTSILVVKTKKSNDIESGWLDLAGQILQALLDQASNTVFYEIWEDC